MCRAAVRAGQCEDAVVRIVIVGGGIGGCALALALHDAGFDDVSVYESVREVREIGVGINLLPHAVRELTELGLFDELDDRAVRTGALAYHNRFGQRIWSEPRGTAAGYHWPQLSIHRGELLGVLHRATVARLGSDRVSTGHHLVGFEHAGDGVAARFSAREPGAGDVEVEADVLVACDGVHSTVRALLVPDEGPPLWNGVTMWRGVTVSEPYLDGRTMIMAGVLARRMVVYPIRDLPDGRQLVNWVAELHTDDGRPMPRQEWDATASPAEPLRHFADFRFDWLDVPALIEGCEQVLQYPMVDRDPLAGWRSGRVTLLGDAAHPMYPVGSNGASQAILDARVLAHELASGPDVDAALDGYESQRRPATAAVVLANRQAGPERCMEIVAERAPDGFTDLDAVISPEELAEISVGVQAHRRLRPRLPQRPTLPVRVPEPVLTILRIAERSPDDTEFGPRPISRRPRRRSLGAAGRRGRSGGRTPRSCARGSSAGCTAPGRAARCRRALPSAMLRSAASTSARNAARASASVASGGGWKSPSSSPSGCAGAVVQRPDVPTGQRALEPVALRPRPCAGRARGSSCRSAGRQPAAPPRRSGPRPCG